LKLAIDGESVNAFAKRCGITEGSLRTYLSGTSLPGLDNLVAISEAAKVNIEWLATGKGPMKKEDSQRYDEDLLKAVIETLESYWVKEGKSWTPSEKAQWIVSNYSIALESDLPKEESEIEELIRASEKFEALMSQSVELILDPVKGKSFRKRFKMILKKAFAPADSNKEDFDCLVDELIASYVIRKRMVDGSLKYPVKDEDGTIRLVDFKDLKK
jgi:transcriptional regulator with XRE-family HTH domain